MLRNEVASCYCNRSDRNRVVQGDIFRDVQVQIHSSGTDSELETVTLNLPYAVVLTQDCDLFWDHLKRSGAEDKNHDKWLQTVLIVPAYHVNQFRNGEHLVDLGLKMESIASRDRWLKIQNQMDARYHYLNKCRIHSVPELVIDFKHYYTISRDSLVQAINSDYLTTLDELFREHLSHRFANYLSRIALPEIKSPPASDELT